MTLSTAFPRQNAITIHTTTSSRSKVGPLIFGSVALLSLSRICCAGRGLSARRDETHVVALAKRQ